MTRSDVSWDGGLVDACRRYLESITTDAEAFMEAFPSQKVFSIDYEHLDAWCTREDVPLCTDLKKQPNRTVAHFEGGLKRMYADYYDLDADSNLLTKFEDLVRVRINGYIDSDTYEVGQYRPDDVAGRMIHIRGQVTKRSKRKLRDEIVAFECLRCGRLNHIQQTGDKIREPHECRGCEGSGPWDIDEQKSEMRDYQMIRLQILPEHSDTGDTETIDMRVMDELVGDMSPGDRVVINAIMRTKREGDNSRVKTLFGVVHGFVKLTSDHTDVEIEPHEDDIAEIRDADDTYERVFQSIAPSHYGDDRVKEALAFTLFSGVRKELPDGSQQRGNSHLIMIGDPGTGKSSLIRRINELVPRSEYASGKQTTGPGLTAAAVQDDFGDGAWTLEAGTLVRAHNGVAAIDELDKMDPDDRSGLLEAMSEQQISIHKAASGVLPAECTVIAAANPKYGSFDPSSNLGDQLDLNSVLLSRFDLWFVMQDEVDEDRDERIARHTTVAATAGQKMAASREDEISEEEASVTKPPIEMDTLRAYIAKAKRIYPVFDDEARSMIVREYVNLRQENSGLGPVPTTHRAIQALHRLSEASARIRHSTTVTGDDVERAINLHRFCLESLGVDPATGDLDAMRMETGTASSTRDRMKALLGIIRSQCDDESPADVADVRDEAMVLMTNDEFDETYTKLKDKREIYEPDSDTVRPV